MAAKNGPFSAQNANQNGIQADRVLMPQSINNFV
jgi:hypothetical protein